MLSIGDASVVATVVLAGTTLILKYIPSRNGKAQTGVTDILCKERMGHVERNVEEMNRRMERMDRKLDDVLIELRK
jgi:hypothetical protein